MRVAASAARSYREFFPGSDEFDVMEAFEGGRDISPRQYLNIIGKTRPHQSQSPLTRFRVDPQRVGIFIYERQTLIFYQRLNSITQRDYAISLVGPHEDVPERLQRMFGPLVNAETEPPPYAAVQASIGLVEEYGGRETFKALYTHHATTCRAPTPEELRRLALTRTTTLTPSRVVVHAGDPIAALFDTPTGIHLARTRTSLVEYRAPWMTDSDTLQTLRSRLPAIAARTAVPFDLSANDLERAVARSEGYRTTDMALGSPCRVEVDVTLGDAAVRLYCNRKLSNWGTWLISDLEPPMYTPEVMAALRTLSNAGWGFALSDFT